MYAATAVAADVDWPSGTGRLVTIESERVIALRLKFKANPRRLCQASRLRRFSGSPASIARASSPRLSSFSPACDPGIDPLSQIRCLHS